MKKGGTMIVDQSSLLDSTSAYWEGFLFYPQKDLNSQHKRR